MAAARNNQTLKQAFRIFSPGGADREGLSSRSTPDEEDQYFEESDVDNVWSCNLQPETRSRPIQKCRPRAASKISDRSSASKSVPVKVPKIWSKILSCDEYNNSYSGNNSRYDHDLRIEEEEEEEEEVDVERLPPHEMVIRRREPSPSVVEGVGRTLKESDMISVRNAILTLTGFQD